MNRRIFLGNAAAFGLALPVSGRVLKRLTIYHHSLRSMLIDKDNTMVQAICLFGTPNGDDGKNKNNSNVTVLVAVDSYDNLYGGSGYLGDNTEVGDNFIRPLNIDFRAAAPHIIYDAINSFTVTILGSKPDLSGGGHDHWDLRWEFYLVFKKGQILSTGYCEPKIEYDFTQVDSQINLCPPNVGPPKNNAYKHFWLRNEMKPAITLNMSTL
jgi:hypothetical protein